MVDEFLGASGWLIESRWWTSSSSVVEVEDRLLIPRLGACLSAFGWKWDEFEVGDETDW